MNTREVSTNKPVLYWITLAIMYAAFAAVAMS